MRRIILLLALCLATPSLSACPSCGTAVGQGKNSTNAHVPAAFYISILFMLSMPVLLVSGFGMGFYLLSRKPRRVAAPLANVAGPDTPSLSASPL